MKYIMFGAIGVASSQLLMKNVLDNDCGSKCKNEDLV
jgi:hypothetical protein